MLARRKLLLQRPLTRALLTRSSVQGPTQPPLSAKTLSQFFAEDILAHHADRPALISKHELAGVHATPWMQKDSAHDLHWSFAEFHAHIEALSRGLQDMGIVKGDRVGVVMGNSRSVLASPLHRIIISALPSSAYAILQWACARVGAIIVTINPAYKMHELVRCMALYHFRSHRWSSLGC